MFPFPVVSVLTNLGQELGYYITPTVVFFIKLLLVNVYHYTQQLRKFNYWIHTLKLPMQFIY